jgi:hypothetical protein
MLAVMMENLKEKYSIKNLAWEIKNNIVFFSGELKKNIVAGYVGEKPVSYEKKLDFNSFRVADEKVEKEIDDFFQMLENVFNK